MFYRLIFSVFLFLFLSSCNTSFSKDELSLLLDVETVEIINSQTLEEWAGVQGDGFTLETYELSEKTLRRFINHSSKNLPDRKEKNKNWQKHNWSKAPIDSSFNEIFTICLSYSSDNKKIKVQLNEIKKLVKKKETYYSFYYRPDKENPQNVRLFVLDVQSKKFYAIDQQI